MAGFSREGLSGVSVTMHLIQATADSAGNGCRPVASSYSTTPSEKMSEALVVLVPWHCSGDMYGTVPTIAPGAEAVIATEL